MALATFDEKQVAQLAQIAGISGEKQCHSLARFQDLLLEAALSYRAGSGKLKNARKKMCVTADQARKLSSNLDLLLFDERVRRAMLGIRDEKLHRPMLEFQDINGLRQRLRDLAVVLEKAEKDPDLPKRSGGRPRDTGNLTAAICVLAMAWEEASPGRRATTITYRDTDEKGGPFVDFARTAFELLDPEFRRRTGFGQTVYSALAERRAISQGPDCR